MFHYLKFLNVKKIARFKRNRLHKYVMFCTCLVKVFLVLILLHTRKGGVEIVTVQLIYKCCKTISREERKEKIANIIGFLLWPSVIKLRI